MSFVFWDVAVPPLATATVDSLGIPYIDSDSNMYIDTLYTRTLHMQMRPLRTTC